MENRLPSLECPLILEGRIYLGSRGLFLFGCNPAAAAAAASLSVHVAASNYFRPVVVKFYELSESKGFVRIRVAGPISGVSDSVDRGWGPQNLHY